MAVCLVVLTACGTEATAVPTVAPPTITPFTALQLTPPPQPTVPARPTTPSDGPPHIIVQHILISFVGTGTKATRSKEEARKLADEVFAKAKAGEDYDGLVKQYTDDQFPGVYQMSNVGATPSAAGEYPREGMMPAFGNVGFRLQPGEIGMAEFDPQISPFGWHIIKRLAAMPTPAPSPTTQVVPVSTGPLPKFMIVETTKGTIKIQLYGDAADGVVDVVRNYADKAKAGYFDGLKFHRVEDWVVQGGDPLGTGTGGGDIKGEYNKQPFKRGAVGVASKAGGGAAINDSQWFVVKKDSDSLNGQYSNFGQVVSGMEVVDKLEKGDKMTKVTVADQ